MKVGIGSIAQAKIQSAFGTPATPDTKLNLASESIGVTRNHGDEGNLLPSKTRNQRDLMSLAVGGGMSFILRPEMADWLFEAALGKKSSGVYTLADVGSALPVSTVVMSRAGVVKTYPDITIRSITITAPSQDYVRVSIEVIGTKELNAGDTGAQTIQSISFTLPSYRCTAATLKYGTAGSAATTALCVENTEITIDNGIEEAPATYCQGLYAGRPAPGLRNVGVNFQLPFSSDTDTFRKTYYTDPAAPALSLELTFTTDNEDESIVIEIPHLGLNNAEDPVGGTGIIEASFSGEALSVGADEPITVTVTHDAA